ncbi:hypothetical protein D3C80_2101620 [compost metagenome]
MSGNAVAKLLAFLAKNNGRSIQLLSPFGNGAVIATHRPRYKSGIGSKVLVVAHIDNHRRVGRADDAV